MAFSSFNEFLFMASIDSWRVPRSRYLSFRNRKKSQGAKSGEYEGSAMTFVSCLAKNLVSIRLECDSTLSSSRGDALHTQNMNHNVLNRSIRDVESLCYLSNATIFFTFSMLSSLTDEDRRIAWDKFSMISRPSLNALCHSNTCVPDSLDSPKYFCNIFKDFVVVISLETQNFKQTRCSIFFSLVKIARQTFRVVNAV